MQSGGLALWTANFLLRLCRRDVVSAQEKQQCCWEGPRGRCCSASGSCSCGDILHPVGFLPHFPTSAHQIAFVLLGFACVIDVCFYRLHKCCRGLPYCVALLHRMDFPFLPPPSSCTHLDKRIHENQNSKYVVCFCCCMGDVENSNIHSVWLCSPQLLHHIYGQ